MREAHALLLVETSRDQQHRVWLRPSWADLEGDTEVICANVFATALVIREIEITFKKSGIHLLNVGREKCSDLNSKRIIVYKNKNCAL